MHQTDAFSEQINIEQRNVYKKEIEAKISHFTDEEKLIFCREIKIDEICETIEKFPLHTQKEMIAIIITKFLRQWKRKYA